MKPDAQTPTPRTDAAELDALIVDLPGQQTTDKVVRSIIARQLERELTAERERGRRVREETIEECAKVCESRFHGSGYRNEHERFGANQELSACATAIRTLSRAESAPEGGKQDVPTVREE